MRPRYALAAVLAIAATLAAALALVATLPGRSARAADAPKAAAPPKVAYLGATFMDLPARELRENGLENGVVIVALDPDGPAAREGLIEGDIVTEFEGQPVRHAYEIYGKVRRMRVGELARVRYWRDGSEQPIELVPLGGTEYGPLDDDGPAAYGVEGRLSRLEHQVADLERKVMALEQARGPER